jgi:outer membrane lipoprotein-sorting protein
MPRLMLALACAVIASVSAVAQQSSSVIDSFRSRYGSLKSVDVSFESKGMSGRVRAQKGGKYRIEVSDRLFICDTTTVWNVQSATTTVIVNRYQPNAESMSIDRVFFVLMNVYRPTVLRMHPTTVIRLLPPDPSATIAGVTHADIALNAKGTITSISVSESGVESVWNVTRLLRNPTIAASTFSYVPPTGWTVINLR